jgi:protein-disulfide isomerase
VHPRPWAVGLVAAVALILAGCGSGAEARQSTSPGAGGAVSLSQRFGGIPQHAAFLGSPRAPYRMVEFVDLQCPYCARFDRDVLPAVVERFVRPGRLRLELSPIAVLGPDSAAAGAAAVAAGMQDRMWQFADLLYRNQGPENSGYVTPAFVARIAAAVPGLDARRVGRQLVSAPVSGRLADDLRAARTARVTETPTFWLGRTNEVLAPFAGRLLARRDFLRRLDAAIGG